MILLALFVLGTMIGSFLNVCIWRLPRHESVAHPPSHCPNCNTRLKALDLMPLLSQLYLRGKCRYCGMRFSWRYFGIELLTGLLFVLAGAQAGNLAGGGFLASWSGDPVRLVRDLLFMATLVVVFFVDYDTRLIQLESVFLLGLSGLLYDAYSVWTGKSAPVSGGNWGSFFPGPIPQSVLAMTATALGLWLLRELFSWIYGREALGFGDVILVAAIGANLGWNATLITFFFLAVMLGASIGVALQIPRAVRSYRWGKRRTARYGGGKIALALARHAFRKAMPFGPMLAMGAIAALLYGQSINSAYLTAITPVPTISAFSTTTAPAPGGAQLGGPQ